MIPNTLLGGMPFTLHTALRLLSMVSLNKYKIVKLLAKNYTIEILSALSEKPLRYAELKKHCPNDRTRTIRLKELKKVELISVIVKEVENHDFLHYQITEKGRKTLQLINQLTEIWSPST